MKAWSSVLLAAAASLALASAAAGQESPVKEPAEPAAPLDGAVYDGDGDVDFSFNVGLASDYVFRGISQTDEGAQLFGGVDVAFGNNNYAGVWASNVDFSGFGDTETNLEVDFYIGVKPEVAGFVLDFAGIFYTYHNQPKTSPELNYFEFKAAASRAIGPATFGGAVYYSPEFSGDIGAATYVEANAAYTLNDRISFSGAVGHQDLKTAFDYSTLNIGATFAVTPNVGIDVRYHATDEDGFGDVYDDRVVASLKATF